MATVNYDAYKVKQDSFRALRDDVIVEEMEFGERKLSSGIIMLSDDGKDTEFVHVGAKYMPLVLNKKMYLSVNGFVSTTDVGLEV